jgi:hypothetical protein
MACLGTSARPVDRDRAGRGSCSFRPAVGASPRLSVVDLQELEEIPDLVVDLRRMAHRCVPIKRVAVTSTFTFLGDISRFYEVRDDPLCGTFRDPHRVGDVPQPHRRVPVQAEEYLGVTGEEVPAVYFRT